MNGEERIISGYKIAEDEAENKLRPKLLEDFVGQEKIKQNLGVYMKAAKVRGDSLDHVLLCGPPGLGKTTLAHIIANEMHSQLKVTSGPALERAADLASIVSNLEEGDVLFIDEIHRMSRSIEEILYPAMEDFALDFMVGKGPTARSMRLALKKFTLVGATTRAGMLSSPLRDRFGVVLRLELYSPDELTKIIIRAARTLGIEIEKDAAIELARRSRGTPRIAIRLLRRVRDFATVEGAETIKLELAKDALKRMDIDNLGLDNVDKTILETIIDKFGGGPVGLDTLAAATNEEPSTIEDVAEPYLLQLGFIARTPRGRVCTAKAYEHLNRKVPTAIYQSDIFSEGHE